MATATCRNEDCGRTSWELRKHPDDYARGVSCPDCGTTRIDIDGAEERARAPDRREPERAQDARPARAEPAGGAGFEDMFAVADSDMPAAQRAKSARNLLGTVGKMVEKFQMFQEQKRRAAERRAEQAELREVDLPSCPECGYQFSPEDIGVADTRVRCPDCGGLWEIDAPAAGQ